MGRRPVLGAGSTVHGEDPSRKFQNPSPELPLAACQALALVWSQDWRILWSICWDVAPATVRVLLG